MAENILIISSRSDTGGGGEHYIQNIITHIDRNRYKPFVAIPRDGTLKIALEKLDIEVINYNSFGGWLEPDELWYQALSTIETSVEMLVDYIQRNNIKIIHTNSNIRWEGALAANLAGIHHIHAIRIDFDPSHHLYKRFELSLPSFACIMSSLSTFILSVSNNCTKSLSPTIPSNKIRTINNGIDQEYYDTIFNKERDSIRIELGIPRNAPLIIAAGRIVPDKGFDIYLDAAISVIQNHPTAHFLIAGSHENKQLYKTLREKSSSSIANINFHFLGYRSDIERILVAADIFVLSSRHEGQSNALLEAMACQCAVIATRCSGVEDAIIHLDSGIIVEIADSLAIADAITSLLDNPEELDRYASSAKQRIVSHFQIQDKVMDLMQLYNDTLSLPPPIAGSPSVRLFLNTASEIATLGKKNIELENRVRRLENFVNLIQYNFFTKCIRSIKRYLTKLRTPTHTD